MILIFWLLLALLFYIYFGYPTVVAWMAQLKQRPVAKDDNEPTVTVLIAAFNEAEHIEATVTNKLAQTYPAEKLEVIVISDGSDDGTDELVLKLAAEDSRVKLLVQTPRAGKTSALNMAIPEATGEIIVFSDANSVYKQDAIAHLVRNFADPDVGYVTGQMIYGNPESSMTGEGCSAYMKYENALRQWETDIGSVVGVDGGIDCMRRELYLPMNADQLPDFVQPLKVVEQGYRVVYEARALLGEDALDDSGREYRMRVRVGLRALWGLWDMRQLFSGSQDGLFRWQLFSHKLLRYLAFIPQVLLLLVNLPLASQGGFFAMMLLLQLGFYGLALLGHYRPGSGALFSIPYYFSLINVASAHAFLRFAKGEKVVLWKPRVG
ncbi:glycosyltransferase family 2 protein [Corallincola holothuriorum]|uniref:Glycosyltransferase family 2 protein n=1 Tax=Corallincola holothuriorum TaxID=2282215 RepID=A0A368N4M1_9GAMM|nr:glycosyltransferase family 2 protein [Corallincola holothuriorum]RCU45166.1 glycosyltransferase family 2 protein [Corallincola holothuriorum]